MLSNEWFDSTFDYQRIKQHIRTLTFKLIQKEKRIVELKDKVKRLEKQLDQLTANNIYRIVNVDWYESQFNFNRDYSNFHQKLTEQYPLLSSEECMVCNLIRAGLKTKEIAQLKYVSPRTIESHRYNIRCKMKLETKQSLSMLLKQIE